ncbi:MAG TPA: ATPase, T2SS/T4P/T4SS family, partial [Candidatus Saccharimonadales bacterium]
MDEDKTQERRRDQDEKATQQRAAILGLQYLDAREVEETLPLTNGILTLDEMYKGYIIPLTSGGGTEPFRFGVTSQTPQSLIQKMAGEYNDRGELTQFLLMSGSGFKAFMNRYDPPKEIIYDDIQIAKDGDSDTIKEVSKTLNSVGSDLVFDYLVDQADKLGASDIHIENERTYIRVRMRIDGALHAVADLEKERYRVIMGALASRANISTAATEAQSGHMQKEITTNGETHLLNLRVETVPTLYGQDAVLRLFNFDESLLDLDLLGIPPAQRAQIDEVISHPRGMVLMVGPTGSGKSTTLYSIPP